MRHDFSATVKVLLPRVSWHHHDSTQSRPARPLWVYLRDRRRGHRAFLAL